jgi:hypothetical protein
VEILFPRRKRGTIPPASRLHEWKPKFNSGAHEMKNLLLTFTLLGVSIASAKTYTITLSSPAAIGNSQLKSGENKLELKGDSILVKDGKMVNEFPVHVENEARKFDNTSVTTSSQGGSNRIEEIRLGGTTVKLYSAISASEHPASAPSTNRPE